VALSRHATDEGCMTNEALASDRINLGPVVLSFGMTGEDARTALRAISSCTACTATGLRVLERCALQE
jgi:hypothetical protein